MRHLHFTQSLEPLTGGGMGLSTVALHRHMMSLGVASTLCATYGQAPQCPADHVLEFRRIKPDFLYYSPEMRARGADLVAQADVVHGHGFYVGTNLVFGREARRQHKPLVYHCHGFFEPWILNRSRWKKHLVHWLFEDANFRHVRLWRALTEKEASQIRACGIRGPIVLAPVGIDPAMLAPPPDLDAPIDTPLVPNLVKSRRRALFISRLHPKKGLDLLVPAWASLGKTVADWELILAGPDEGGYAVTIDRLISAHGLSESVRRVGKVSAEAKVRLLHSADLFVLPSYSEGFPTSLLEAMACAAPVLATRECNFPEVTNSQAGWECDASVESVSAALRTALLADEAERKQRGLSGRKLVETRYTWPSVVTCLLEACETHCA